MRKLFLMILIFAFVAKPQNISDSLTNQLSKIFNSYTIAGMSVIIVKKDSIVYRNHFG
ncbi:MAG TPA: hypothetical protein PLI27_04960 [Ignavibacteriales bacterium]|nr:hypothetical protein [Ignavibacteriales bacterium]HOL80407.1 hypothetical protein [Ignavibacteriales bacterium]HOM64858.1 hypothetical protein [Ignavibacteriales bacterium]HPD67409.1 hypothetical protein [Ignavibacteriales bacterium]HPP32596.1 hypothetical protein [Ignavibacteriales bacterium]